MKGRGLRGLSSWTLQVPMLFVTTTPNPRSPSADSEDERSDQGNPWRSGRDTLEYTGMEHGGLDEVTALSLCDLGQVTSKVYNVE